MMEQYMARILTCGTFDLFHIGHLNILENAKAFGDILVVGVSTDELVKKYKGNFPVFNFEQRLRIIRSLKCVDVAVAQYDLDKTSLVRKLGIDLIVMGDDWWDKDFKGVCETVFLPYTKGISTSQIIKRIKNEDDKSNV
jgi:glycerol-3-phosphate cytidylyltransferase